MDALQDGTLYTTKSFSAQRELLEPSKKLINEYHSWPEHEDTYIQVPIIERHKACHMISFLFSLQLSFCVSFLVIRMNQSTRNFEEKVCETGSLYIWGGWKAREMKHQEMGHCNWLGLVWLLLKQRLGETKHM